MKNMNSVMFMLVFSSLSISAMDEKASKAAKTGKVFTAQAIRLKRAQNIAYDDVNPHNRHAAKTAGKSKDILKAYNSNKF